MSVPFTYYYFAEYKPVQHGYYNDDYSIRKPMRDSLLTKNFVFSLTFIIPLFMIIATELNSNKVKSSKVSKTYGSNYKIIINIYIFIGLFIFGKSCEITSIILIKKYIGRLRPTFFYNCRINTNVTFCDIPLYIAPSLIHCRLRKGVSDIYIRTSFPCGMCAFVASSTIFVMMYIHIRWNPYKWKLFSLLFQYFCMLCTMYVCAAHYVTNENHATDIIGSLIHSIILQYLLWKVFLEVDPNIHMEK